MPNFLKYVAHHRNEIPLVLRGVQKVVGHYNFRAREESPGTAGAGLDCGGADAP